MTEEGESSAAVAEDGDRAAPQPDTEKSPRTDIGSDATAAEKGRGAETAPAASPDGRSFSRPISGAKASPSGSPRPPPILTIPVVAVPCFLAPAALIESPGFAGQFAMTHQAVLATVTAQAHVQMQAAYPLSSETMTSTFPHCMLPAASPVSSQQMSPASETYSGDVYHWRKYGQKQVKNTENSRSYYRCANSNCLAKKKVECCPDGKIQEVIYKGKHDHDPPQKYRYTRDRGAQSSGPSRDHESLEHQSNEPIESDPLACKTEHNSGNETPEQRLYCSSDCEGDAGIMTEKGLAEEPDPKRRLSESSKSSTMSVPKTVREYIVQTEIDARHLSDGYRWRKYGQKFVKGNPNPRSYYRCTHDGCPVRKHVERASHDAKSLLITYEGKHSHDQPMPRHGSDQPAIDSSTSATGEDSLSDKNSSKDLNSKNIVKKVAGDEAPASAQAVTSIKDGSAVKEPTLMV